MLLFVLAQAILVAGAPCVAGTSVTARAIYHDKEGGKKLHRSHSLWKLSIPPPFPHPLFMSVLMG